MKQAFRALAAALLLVAACTPSQRVLMPPRLDLHGLGTIGMVDFASNSTGGLSAHASREFLAAVQSAQPGVPILELGRHRDTLAEVGHRRLTPDAVRELGRRHGIDALIVGTVETKPLRPRFSLHKATVKSKAGAAADVEAAMRVQLYDAHTGATLWSATSNARETVAKVVVGSDDFAVVRASDPSDAEARLVYRLVHAATTDLTPYWVRQ